MNDPFANLDKTETPTTGVEEEKKEESAADYFLNLDLEMGEEEFEQPAAFIPYQMPADRAWVPVRITDSSVEVREMRLVIKNPETGQEEIVDKVSTPRFELEAEHVAQCYGERSRPYLLAMPIADATIPFRSSTKRKGLGFKKISGRKLLAATRALKPGQKLDPQKLDDVAASMVDKIVMAQVRRVDKEYTDSDPMKDAQGNIVRAQVDEHGVFVKIHKKDDGLQLEDGTPFNGDTSRLIEHDGGYLIPDPSDDGAPVKVVRSTTRTFDNLQDDVAPVPNRTIQITRQDGSQASAQITWETVGQVTTKPVKPGTMVQAVTEEGELMTASWIGTCWSQTPLEHNLEITEMGAVHFVPLSQETSVDGLGGLDEFKG